MSEFDPQVKEKIATMISRSRESLLVARLLYNDGHYNDAASKSYYAAFHALQAALLSIGLTFSKHSGVIAAFNKNFVLKGLFPKDFSQKISRLYRDRLIGDYEYDENVSQEESQQDLADVEELVRAIEAHLRRRELLDA